MATSNSRRAIITDKDPRNTGVASPLDAAIPSKVMTIVRKPTQTAQQAAAETEEDTVMVNVPKAFTLTSDDGVATRYEVGAHRVPRSHAEHWFSKAHGLKIV